MTQTEAINAFYTRLDGITDRYHRVVWRRLRATQNKRTRRNLVRGVEAFRLQSANHFSIPDWWDAELDAEALTEEQQ